jgi:predicted ferric reductase
LTGATRDRILFALALVTGVATWLVVGAAGGQREAWDSSLYALVGLPVVYALLAVFGYVGSRAAWRWPMLVFGGQLLAMLAKDGAPGSLLPLGALLLTFLALLGLLPAYLGVALRRMRQRLVAARVSAARREAAGPGGGPAGA